MDNIQITLQNSSFEYDEGVLKYINVGFQGKCENGNIFFQGAMDLTPEEADEFGVRDLNKAVSKILKEKLPDISL